MQVPARSGRSSRLVTVIGPYRLEIVDPEASSPNDLTFTLAIEMSEFVQTLPFQYVPAKLVIFNAALRRCSET